MNSKRIEVAVRIDVPAKRDLDSGHWTQDPGHGIDYSRKDANCRIKLI